MHAVHHAGFPGSAGRCAASRAANAACVRADSWEMSNKFDLELVALVGKASHSLCKLESSAFQSRSTWTTQIALNGLFSLERRAVN